MTANSVGKSPLTRGSGPRAGVISPTFVLVRIHPNGPGGPDLVHVIFSVGIRRGIDDIDLENTMDNSVTVVEWGRERVEHLSDSRLDVDAPDGGRHGEGGNPP